MPDPILRHDMLTVSARAVGAALGAAGVLACAWWLLAERSPPAPSERPAEVVAPGTSPARAASGAPRAPIARQPVEEELPPPTPVLGVVQVRACDDGDGLPLAGFAWTLSGAVAGVAQAGSTVGYVAEVAVPVGRAAALRVEAPGYVPSLPVDVSLPVGMGLRAVVTRLVRLRPGACIALRVRDGEGAPIERVRVTCWRRPQASERDADAGRNLWLHVWSREARAAGGEHRFPDLGAGRYRFRIQALEADGRTRLLLPVTSTAVFDAVQTSTHAIEVRELAGSLVVSVHDPASGRPLGPEVSLSLAAAGGASLPQQWVALDRDPPDVAAGVLPSPEPCELVEAIAPGRYLVRAVGPGLDAQRSVDVAAGARVWLRWP